ncbi:hypothetical protein E3N88_08434 [Mikania micrantha]|uniref:Uncharacterized protein n=1 Tax=Mikania micrantha TaxID=192012 RepID=A0A5N6PH77_9ASTR|nr:hypothetical protein E3N88_08434 [Mikania micrantha]
MYKGVLLNSGKTWFSVNKKGEHCEMISFTECLNSDTSNSQLSRHKSRFAGGTYPYKEGKLKTHVKSQFLSPLTTYTVNLVFKFSFLARKCQLIYLRYKLQGETKTSVSYLAYEREDEWWACELFQFTSDCRIVDLEIMFDGFNNCYDLIEVEGIEFRPLKKVEHKDENQSISDSDAYWEEKLPTDYEDIMKWSTDIMQWTTKKEAYSIIRKGFLIDDGEMWFSLDKNGKKCYMLSAAYIESCSKDHLYLSESRRESSEAVSLRKPFVLQKIYLLGSSEALSLSVGIPKCLSCTAFSRSELPFGSNAASEEELLPSEGCLSRESFHVKDKGLSQHYQLCQIQNLYASIDLSKGELLVKCIEAPPYYRDVTMMMHQFIEILD